jgi:hypothetical protein
MIIFRLTAEALRAQRLFAEPHDLVQITVSPPSAVIDTNR